MKTTCKEEYVKKSDTQKNTPAENWNHVCIITTDGWIFEGYRASGEYASEGIQLRDAYVVREWSNGLGIGGLAQLEHKDDYTLDYIGDMLVFMNKIISVIKLLW